MNHPADATQRLVRLEGYLRQDPHNASLVIDTAMAALDSGNSDRAQELVESSAALAADDPQAIHLRALIALARHRFAEAAALLDGLIGRGITASAVRFNLGYARFRLGEHAAAAREFEALLPARDAPVDTLAYLLRCHHHAGDLAAAVSQWHAAPGHLKSPATAGVASLVFLDAGDMAQAAALADQALHAEPAPLEALVVRGTLAVGQGRSGFAEALLQQAMERSPDDGRVWSALATAWMMQGDVERAQTAFLRAAELLPTHIGTWLALAWCQILRRDLAAARHSLDSALALDRNFGETHGAFAVLAALQGQDEEARRAIELAKRLDRSGLSARYAEAVLSGQARDPAAVQALARRLLSGRPGIEGVALLERALQAVRRDRG